MATIKDVAREAGVSMGTVSNYLNKKVTVSEKTAEKIQKAITKLHYVVQNSGRELRKQQSNVIGLVFPNISEPYYEKIVSSIKGYIGFHGDRYSTEISLTENNAQREEEVLKNYIGRNISGIIIYSCNPDNEELFILLENSGIPYVMVDRRPENLDCNQVYLDNFTLFYELSRHYLTRPEFTLALAIDSVKYDENRFALEGYQEACKNMHREEHMENVFYGEASREHGFKLGMSMCQRTENIPQIILTTSYKMAEGIRYAYHIHHFDVKKDVRIITTGDVQNDVFYFDQEIMKTSRSAYEVGEKICQLLLDNIRQPYMFEKKQYCVQDVLDIGKYTFPEKKLKKPEIQMKKTLQVVVLDDKSAISGLSSLLVDFYYKTGIKVELKKVLPQDMFSYIQHYMETGKKDVDVFMFDIPWLYYLADRGYLKNLSHLAEKHALDTSSFVPDALKYFGLYKEELYALPFMLCTQLLFYRRDLFQELTIRAQYENTCKLALKVPYNWHQYNMIARFFTAKFNPASPVRYGHSMSLSYPEELICALMPRLWEAKADLYDPRGHIYVDSKPMRKAVKELLESVLYADPNVILNKPIDALENFMQGDTAMISAYYNYARDILDPQKSKVTDTYSFSKIPGNPVMAGWCLGLSCNTQNEEEAFEFIKWTTGENMAVPHTILGGQSPNVSIYRNYDLVSMYPWLTRAILEIREAKERRTPVTAKGNVMNEKQVENSIYEALFPLIEQAVYGVTVEYGQIKPVLESLQHRLSELEYSIDNSNSI